VRLGASAIVNCLPARVAARRRGLRNGPAGGFAFTRMRLDARRRRDCRRDYGPGVGGMGVCI